MLFAFIETCYKPIANRGIDGLLILLTSDKLVAIIILVFVELLLITFSMKTVINNDGIFVKIIPMRKYQQFAWQDIEKAYIRKYKTILEYGGWGYRLYFGIGKKLAYNIRGNIGLQLELKNGKKVLIGTQRGGDIEEILKMAEAEKLLQQ
jgi:hypothetical protein